MKRLDGHGPLVRTSLSVKHLNANAVGKRHACGFIGGTAIDANQDAFVLIDDMLGQDYATSELYIDLTRTKEFNEKDICADVKEKKRREAFAADMKDMLQEFIDMGED